MGDVNRNSGKEVIEIFASAARTATPTAATFSTRSAQCLIFIDVTAATSTPSTVFTVIGVSPGDKATEYTILASAAIVGVGMTVLRISPHLTAAANTIAKDILPSTIKVTAVHGNANSQTYSVTFVGSNP